MHENNWISKLILATKIGEVSYGKQEKKKKNAAEALDQPKCFTLSKCLLDTN